MFGFSCDAGSVQHGGKMGGSHPDTRVGTGQGLKNISVLDIYGREIKSFTSGNLFFNAEDFSEGIYFVRIMDKSSGQAVTKKVFITR